MPSPVIPIAAGAATSILSKILGGRKSKMDPHSLRLYRKLMDMYEGEVPEWLISNVSAPYNRLRRGIKQHYARQPGSSGIVSSVLGSKVASPQARAVGQATQSYKADLLGMAQQVLASAHRQPEQGWGDVIGDIGGDVGFWLGLKDVFKLGNVDDVQGIMESVSDLPNKMSSFRTPRFGGRRSYSQSDLYAS